MIWHRRAALNTPWNPFMDPNQLARYEWDRPDIDYRLADATHVDRSYSTDLSGNANKHGVQNTLGSMAILTPNDVRFGGHNSVAKGWFATGVFAVALPFTIYTVGVALAAASEIVTDTLSTGRCATYVDSANKYSFQWGGLAAAVGATNMSNVPFVRCDIFGGTGGAISYMYVNKLPVRTVANGGSAGINGLHLLSDLNGTSIQQTGVAHVSLVAGADLTYRRKLDWLADKYRIVQ